MEKTGLDELLRRARRHESAALDELVARFSPRIYGLLYRLTGRRDVAEDLTQETLLRMVRTIGDYQHSGRFEAWLFRIAANLARDRARQLGRRGVPLSLDGGAETDALAPDLASGVDDPPAQLERDEAGAQVAAAVDALSESDREIILLRHYSELSFREIAELLGVPLGTALARAHRALKRLREILEIRG